MTSSSRGSHVDTDRHARKGMRASYKNHCPLLWLSGLVKQGSPGTNSSPRNLKLGVEKAEKPWGQRRNFPAVTMCQRILQETGTETMGWGSHLGWTALAVCISYLLFKPLPGVSALKMDLDVWEVGRVVSFGFLCPSSQSSHIEQIYFLLLISPLIDFSEIMD